MEANVAALTDIDWGDDSANSPIEELTIDGWFNTLTGQGLLNKDKAENVGYAHVTRFAREEAVRSLYRGDPIAARAVDLVVDDAMRQGWSVEFTTKDDNGKSTDIDPDTAAEINAARIEWEKNVGLARNVELWWKRGRAYGGTLMVFGLDDGVTDKGEEVNLNRIKSFDWLRPLTRHECSNGELSSDPKKPLLFGKPSTYWLHSRVITDVELSNTNVHASRTWRYDGIQVDELASRTDNLDGWGDSIFERIWVPLRNWNSAVNAAGTIIQDFSQSIYSIDGLRQILRANAESLITKQFELQDRYRSIWNATVIDSKDNYERKTTSVAGMSDLIDRFGLHLSAASGMPLTLLLGISPGGFGTGEAEENNWINIIQSAQKHVLVPLLERIYSLLFATPEFKSKLGNVSWKVVPNPLRQKSESDQADIQNKQANTDKLYIDAGVLDPHEVAESRFGGGGFSLNTTLDNETREEFEKDQTDLENNGNSVEPTDGSPDVNAPDASGEAKPADAAMNGAQVTGLIDIVSKVATKELPRDSAIAILQVAYLLSPEDATKVVGSAGEGFDPDAEPEETEPAPNEVPPGLEQNNEEANSEDGNPDQNAEQEPEPEPEDETQDETESDET